MEVIDGVDTAMQLPCLVEDGEGERCPVFALYPCIYFAAEEKSQKNLGHGSQKVLS